MLKSPTQADLRQAVETVPVPRVGGGQRDLPVAIRATLVNFVLTNADVEALVKQGPSGTFASAYSSIAHSENAPFQKAAALEETTAALEIIRDQDRSDPNFTDLAVFFTGTLRTKKGSPSKRGVVLTAAGKLRVLASGPRPINLVYCAAISDYLTNLLEAKAKHKKDHAGYVMENQQLRDKSKKRHLVSSPPTTTTPRRRRDLLLRDHVKALALRGVWRGVWRGAERRAARRAPRVTAVGAAFDLVRRRFPWFQAKGCSARAFRRQVSKL